MSDQWPRPESPLIERRNRILDVARACIEDHGIKFSMSEVASICEIAVGTIYLHFKTKEDMMAALLLQDIQRGDDPLQALVRYVAVELQRVAGMVVTTSVPQLSLFEDK